MFPGQLGLVVLVAEKPFFCAFRGDLWPTPSSRCCPVQDIWGGAMLPKRSTQNWWVRCVYAVFHERVRSNGVLVESVESEDEHTLTALKICSTRFLRCFSTLHPTPSTFQHLLLASTAFRYQALYLDTWIFRCFDGKSRWESMGLDMFNMGLTSFLFCQFLLYLGAYCT